MPSFSESIAQTLPDGHDGSYSASVDLYLLVNGDRLRLAQVGIDRMYFKEPIALLGGPAELIVEVDGKVKRTNITIPSGQSASRVVEYRTN